MKWNLDQVLKWLLNRIKFNLLNKKNGSKPILSNVYMIDIFFVGIFNSDGR